MFRILEVFDDTTPANRERLAQVQAIIRAQFPGLAERDITKLSGELRNPLKYRFRSMLLVAEDARVAVRGFALLQNDAELHFGYLDYISAMRGGTGQGIGAALYERVREKCAALDVQVLLFECLPDERSLCPDPVELKQNQARLRFYERYGARPVINTAYETPLTPTASSPPYLVVDQIRDGALPGAALMRRIVRAILERKYGERCPPGYIEQVVSSFRDDPVVLRSVRYNKSSAAPVAQRQLPRQRQIALCVNTAHDIHHVRDRGYVESPVRIPAILAELDKTSLFETVSARSYGEQYINTVHDVAFSDYLKRACLALPEGKSVYPYIFPIRNRSRPPKDLPLRAGYYCIDTFTPLNRNAYVAARGAVNCTLTCADLLLEGYALTYSLVRPPGHHAEHDNFGGFCYFNSAAIAAHHLCAFGRVALLDIDYHHGNGSQDIFYTRNDVLFISTHGHPRTTYPYFSGFDDEIGEGDGRGFNLNIPLAEGIDGVRFHAALDIAIKRIAKYSPRFLVVSLGLDTAKDDPTGSWTLRAKDFLENGRRLGRLGLPTLVVQEGGYRTRTLGVNARQFFTGLWQTHQSPTQQKSF